MFQAEGTASAKVLRWKQRWVYLRTGKVASVAEWGGGGGGSWGMRSAMWAGPDPVRSCGPCTVDSHWRAESQGGAGSAVQEGAAS